MIMIIIKQAATARVTCHTCFILCYYSAAGILFSYIAVTVIVVYVDFNGVINILSINYCTHCNRGSFNIFCDIDYSLIMQNEQWSQKFLSIINIYSIIILIIIEHKIVSYKYYLHLKAINVPVNNIQVKIPAWHDATYAFILFVENFSRDICGVMKTNMLYSIFSVMSLYMKYF